MRGAAHNEMVKSCRSISHGDIVNVIPFSGDWIHNESLDQAIIF